MATADQAYGSRDDVLPREPAHGDDVATDDCATSGNASRGKDQYPVPVQKDTTPVEDPINPTVADTDEQLDRDDREAIDKSNILKGSRTRHAKPTGSYQEPGDEEGLSGPDDGTSPTR